MAITPLPTPVPSTDDPANFDARADAFLGALPTFATEANAQAAQISANAAIVADTAVALAALAAVAAGSTELVGFMTGNLTVNAGSKSITLTAPKTGFAANDRIAIVSRDEPTIRMFATINPTPTPTTTAFTATVVSNGVFGSGTYGRWIVMSAAFLSAGASALDMWAGITDAAGVTPLALALAAAFQPLTDAATVSWDTNTQGFNAKVTLGGNRTIGAPTNLKDGWTYSLYLTQDATGGRTASWNAVFDWGVFGAPSLSTGVGKTDQIYGQYSATTGKLHVTFRKAA